MDVTRAGSTDTTGLLVKRECKIHSKRKPWNISDTTDKPFFLCVLQQNNTDQVITIYINIGQMSFYTLPVHEHSTLINAQAHWLSKSFCGTCLRREWPDQVGYMSIEEMYCSIQ